MSQINSEVATILQRAAERDPELPYAGAVTPTEAWQLLQAGQAHIVDVRFHFEREYVGRIPNTKGIEWKNSETGQVNPAFIEGLKEQFTPSDTLLFLCRSGVRSDAAARSAKIAGFSSAYNILGGFEGDLDNQKHRSSLNGWRKEGLPWEQG